MSIPAEAGRTGRTGAPGWIRRISAHRLSAAVALVCVAAAGTVGLTLAAVYRLHVPLIFWDEWYNVMAFRHIAEGTYGFGELASQHNEHRILFPRLFFIADEMLFRLSGLLNVTVTLALQAANAAILIGWMSRIVRPALRRALLAGFVVLALFTLRQEENFSNGFQLQFVGVFTAAALAGSAYVAALGRLGDGAWRSLPFFGLAALCCVVATYTMANGVLLGGVLAATAVLRRAPWRVAAATVALAAALALLFYDGYRPGEDSLPLLQAIAHPLPYLRYVTAYLGNPLGDGVRADQALGTLGLALAAGAAWRIWSRMTRDAASLKLFTLACFVLASAAATAYGRITLGTPQATSDRYATPAYLFWCAIVLFWFPIAFRDASGPAVAASGRRAGGIALGAVMAVLVAAAVIAEATAWPALAARSAALRRVSDSLISGLYDAEAAATYENTPPDEVAFYAPFLREHGLAPFADPVAGALGRPLDTLGRVAAPGDCTGTVATRADAALGERGVRLSGTARDEGTHRAPRRIVVADAQGAVVGFGSASLPSQPSRLWVGYAQAGPGDVLQAFARLADGALCRLGAATVR